MRRKLFIMLLAATMLLGLCGASAAAEARGVMALGSPSGIVELADGSILVSDQFNKVVWRIEPGGEAALYAGKIGVKDIYGEPTGVYRDGSLENSSFLSPWGLAPYLEGMAVTDAKAHAVRYIAEKGVFTAVGSGEAGYKDSHGIKAQFNNPTGMAADASGGLYVADTNNHVIRYISAQGQVSTYAGSPISGRADGVLSAARFCEPTGLCYRNGALYVADSGNHRICKIQDGRVTTVAGLAAEPYDDGAGYADGYADGGTSTARFSSPQGIAVAANGDIYVADTGNGAIRKISGQRVSTVLKQNDADATYPVAPRSILPVNNELLVTDTFAGILIKVELVTEAPVALGYSDVSDSDWFKGAVSYASYNGLFQGTGGGQFSPQMSMSRAMYVTVLSRLEQNTFPDVIIAGDSGFSDVAAGAWYTTPVSWAAYNDIVNGMGDGLFAPDLDVSREQMVTILYRYCVYNGYDMSEVRNIESYHDAAQVSEWALDAMRWACGAGVIKGDDQGNLNPQASATRAEAAQMLKNFCESLE